MRKRSSEASRVTKALSLGMRLVHKSLVPASSALSATAKTVKVAALTPMSPAQSKPLLLLKRNTGSAFSSASVRAGLVEALLTAETVRACGDESVQDALAPAVCEALRSAAHHSARVSASSSAGVQSA